MDVPPRNPLTPVGAYSNQSHSYYGTYDQGGNVGEFGEYWLRDAYNNAMVRLLGGAWVFATNFLSSDMFDADRTSPDGPGSRYGFRLAAAVEPPPYSYRKWQQENFSQEELENPDVSGALAGPNCAGLPNLMQYALGLSPQSPGQAQATVTTGSTEVSFTYQRAANRPDLQYSVQYSDDLQHWSSEGVVQEKRDTQGDMEIWKAVVANPKPVGFFRIKVELLEPNETP